MHRNVIQILPQEIANQIAAGEVVERPSSIVKELVENSIDAHATQIIITLQDGGKSFISVQDNGIGFLKEEVPVAFQRHATSKLKTADELFSLSSFGFRGEALPSIASVSKIKIKSKTRESELGSYHFVEGGRFIESFDVGTPDGTIIEVSDLFFNTPARQKFLKAGSTEQSHITDIITRLALVHNNISFTLKSNNKTLLQIPANIEYPKERYGSIFPLSLVKEIFPFQHTNGLYKAEGYISNPACSTKNSQGMYFFVNGRTIRDKTMMQATLEGYRSVIEKGRYPFVIIFLHLPTQDVDVNVHPQKSEVRFQHSGLVFQTIARGIAQKIREMPWSQLGVFEIPNEITYKTPETAPLLDTLNISEPKSINYVSHKAVSSNKTDFSISSNSHESGSWKSDSNFTKKNAVYSNYSSDKEPNLIVVQKRPYSSLFIVGQMWNSYFICNDNERMYIFDQHAAHERVLYEKLHRQLKKDNIKTLSQSLLFPITLSLSHSEIDLYHQQTQVLSDIGFDIELLSGDTLSVRSVPDILVDKNVEKLLKDVLSSEIVETANGTIQNTIDLIIATCACHAAVRFGDSLSINEIRALLEQMDTIDLSSHCPHGRPVIEVKNRNEIERWFHR